MNWPVLTCALVRVDPLLADADREDSAVRRVDDGGELLNAVHAEVGDRRGAALVLVPAPVSCCVARAGEVFAPLPKSGAATWSRRP